MRNGRNIKVQTSLGLLAILLAEGCAGPSTPFGAYKGFFVSKDLQDQVKKLRQAEYSGQETQEHSSTEAFVSKDLVIRFFPKRQKLHEKSNFKILIEDKHGVPVNNYQLKVLYDGIDVSEQFLSQSEIHISPNEMQIEVTFPRVYLDPLRLNRIEIMYARYPGEEPARASYLPPVCRLKEAQEIVQTENFSPPEEWLTIIEEASRERGFNPNLIAGLIAQESSFNPKALSWAKALGLTQVTPIADRQIASVHHNWPRSQLVEESTYPTLKWLLSSNRLSRNDDWRLDPALSIEGGLTYLKHIQKYWSLSQNEALLAEVFQNEDVPYSKIFLASYNSGPSRVQFALRNLGKGFLNFHSLKEAKKYVRRVTSFCYHFSDKEYSDEDPS